MILTGHEVLFSSPFLATLREADHQFSPLVELASPSVYPFRRRSGGRRDDRNRNDKAGIIQPAGTSRGLGGYIREWACLCSTTPQSHYCSLSLQPRTKTSQRSLRCRNMMTHALTIGTERPTTLHTRTVAFLTRALAATYVSFSI